MSKIRISDRDRERYEKMSQIEASYRKQGYSLIAGVDEVGRGPLAGPVFAAACILPSDRKFLGLNDSKKMTARRREILYEEIVEGAISWHVASVSAAEIDEINILEASRLAMVKALKGLSLEPDLALIDAVSLKGFPYPVLAKVQGDANCNVIAAASVLAKVSRDRLMCKYDELYPEYAFASNKGYGTAEHIQALQEHGACPLHRRSFLKNFSIKKQRAWRTGEQTESYVASFLVEEGFRLVGRRVRIQNLGELDLVAVRNKTLYVIEVKGRSKSDAFGGALNALSSRQVSRIKDCASAFAIQHQLDDMPIELLYAACELSQDGRVEEMHLVPID
ncbi:MAG: ribonuclease HII [Eubacteriales bacterium]|nr:ribonuclease HII [Eubacteriales bacterium]MDD4323553.1 ribonuclease HII [Eubacteriales bacterium]MDD4540923.1 ribonuclease HII [Eubacteriales bacterium]